MTHRLVMLSCGILIAIPLVTTPVAPINWLKKKVSTAKVYCEKGFEPMKNLILFYLAVKYTARTTRKILEIEIPYRETSLAKNPSLLDYIMPSNHDKNLQIHYLKAIPWTIGFLGILGYINDKWEKRKKKRKKNNGSFFFTR